MTATATQTGPKSRWYVVNVYSGFENKVSDAIKEQAAEHGLADDILDVVVPSEQVTEVRRGTKVDVDRKFFPGYILVHMVLNDQSWHLVTSTPRVTGFLGGGAKGRPVPLSKAEAARLTNQLEEGFAEVRKTTVSYEIGEQVRVIDGPFESFTAEVEEVDDDKERLKVSVSIFGRATLVELDFTQVEKIT